MQTERQLQPVDYAKEIAALVADLSLERAAQVYDFVRFLKSQPEFSPLTVIDDDGWLADSEEQMQAEDELWAAAQTRHRDKFSALLAEARAEIENDSTQPMFTDDGEFSLP